MLAALAGNGAAWSVAIARHQGQLARRVTSGPRADKVIE
jgi:hypothetical protein